MSIAEGSTVAGAGGRTPAAGVRTAIASAVGNAVGLTAALRVIFALFMVPVTTAFGWSRGEYMGTVSLAPLMVALLSTPVGWLVDKRGPRAVLVPGMMLFGLAVMGLALNTGSPLVSAGLWALFGVAASTQAPTGYIKALSGWFANRRGLVLGLALGGGSAVGVTLLPLIVGALIASHGWRTAYVVQGAIALVLGGGVMAVWLRDPPKTAGVAPSARDGGALEGALGGAPAIKDVSAWGACRTLTFWLIFAATLMHQVVISGVFAHAPAMLGDRGVDAGAVSIFLALYGLSFTLAQFVAGWAMDRFQTPKVGIPFFIAAVLGVVMLHRLGLAGHGDAITLALTAVVLGVGSGAEVTLEAYFITRYFGLKSTGQIFGMIYMVVVLSSAIGGVLYSLEYDAHRTYELTLTISEVVLAVGVIFIALLKPYVFLRAGGSPQRQRPKTWMATSTAAYRLRGAAAPGSRAAAARSLPRSQTMAGSSVR